jgi:hypothetical protein
MSPKKVDAVQPAIVAELRQAGVMVVDTHVLGHGVPDLVCVSYSPPRNATVALLVEVKGPKGTLTLDEEAFHDAFPIEGPLIIARCAEDVLRWFGLI